MTKPHDAPVDSPDANAEEIHVYAGTAGHSAWFSDDLGQTWVHPNSHSGLYLEARVWTYSAHPLQPGSMLAGTDEGVYRWDETSARWTCLNRDLGDVWALAHDPEDPRTVFAGTRPAGLYRSDDGGSTWTELAAPGISKFSDVNMGPTRVTQILFDPVDRDTLWASIEIGGIYRSKDRGNTWEIFTEGLLSADVHGIAVARTRQGAKRVFASTNRGLHVSDNDGELWRFLEIDSPWQYARAVVVKEGSPSTLFLANGNGPPGNDGRLFRSDDGGDSWIRLPLPGELNSTVWCVATHRSNPDLLFACTNLGELFRSFDGGAHWERLRHQFGEVRALYWRAVPRGTRQAQHSITRRVEKASATP